MGLCKGCSNKWVDDTLKKFFYRVGYMIGDHPVIFVLVPVLLTALAASGFQQMDYEFDPEYLFSPTSGVAKEERAVLEENFPVDYNNFMSSRISRVGKFARLIVTPKDGGNMLRTELWAQLLYLDQVGKSRRHLNLFHVYILGICYQHVGGIFLFPSFLPRFSQKVHASN